MYIYNITFHIDDTTVNEGLMFLKQEYIPKATQNGMLFNPRICFIQTDREENGKSYSVQFYVKNKTILNDWQETVGHVLHRELVKRFGEKIIGFATLMEELDLGI